MQAKLIQLTDEAWQAIDEVRGKQSRAGFIENLLWRNRAIKATGKKRQPRPKCGPRPRKTK